jgi:hypothetical protein
MKMKNLIIIAIFIFSAQSNIFATLEHNATPWVISYVDVDYINQWVEITLNNDIGDNDRYWFSLASTNTYYKEMLATCLTAYQNQSKVTCLGETTLNVHTNGSNNNFWCLKRITLNP